MHNLHTIAQYQVTISEQAVPGTRNHVPVPYVAPVSVLQSGYQGVPDPALDWPTAQHGLKFQFDSYR